MSELAIRSPTDRLAGTLKLLRFHSWSYLLGIPLLAALQHSDSARPDRLLAVFAFASVYFCWGYVFNNLFDVEEDSESRNPFKSMRRQQALVITLALQLALLVLAAKARLLPETVFVVVLNALYSVPPYRLKRFLLPSLLANGLFFSFPYYASVRLLGERMGGADGYLAAFIFFLFLPLQYVHFLEHREGEGKKNGFSQRAGALALFGVLCAIAAFAPGHPIGTVAITLAYSILCSALLFRIESATRARTAVKLASMAFGLCLALLARLGLLA